MTPPTHGLPSLTDPEPWNSAVDGETLLNEITATLRRFVIFAQRYAPETVSSVFGA